MIVWALTDERISGNNQSIAIAEKLSKYYVVKKIKYHFIVNLSIIKNTGLVLVDKIKSDDIFSNFPDIIVCFGKRLSRVTLSIKKRSDKDIFLVNIGSPSSSADKFDLIIVPKYDKIPKRFLFRNNVVEIDGVLSKFNKEKINSEVGRCGEFLKSYAKPIVILLIGGDTREHKYNPKEFGLMISNLSNIINKNSGTLLTIASARVSDECMRQFKQKINCDYYLYDTNWENDPNNIMKSSLCNPYYAFLGIADFIVITGDSMSKISEVCAIGKNVYIYMPKDALSLRHYNFCCDLVEECYVREFSKDTNELEKFRCKILRELDRVADIICKKIEGKK